MSDIKGIGNEEDLGIENLELYVSNVPPEEIEFIKSLLNQCRTEEVEQIIKLWIKEQIEQNDKKNSDFPFDDDDDGWYRMPEYGDIVFDSKGMFRIKILINEYKTENDKNRKENLINQILNEMEKYRRTISEMPGIPGIVPKERPETEKEPGRSL